MKRFCFRCALRVDATAAVCPKCGGRVGELFEGAGAPVPAAARYHLTKLGVLNEGELSQHLSEQHDVPAIRLADFEIDHDVLALVPREMARRLRVVPLNRAGASLLIAVTDLSNILGIDEVHRFTDLNIEVVVASEADISAALDEYYP